jgi:hypothetical protein
MPLGVEPITSISVLWNYELKDDIAASAFLQRFISQNLNEDAAPEALAMELTSLFNHGFDLAH